MSQAEELLLISALESFDMAQKARKIIEKEGLLIKDRFGQSKPHPATVLLNQARHALQKAFRALHIVSDPRKEKVGRPPDDS